MEPEIVSWLLSQKEIDLQAESIRSVEDLKMKNRLYSERFARPVDRALLFGFIADQVAFAFLAGFSAALQHLLPFLKPDSIAAFCVSEEGGNHPRMIKTRLESNEDQASPVEGWKINGYKSFVTGAEKAEILFIAASAGIDESGNNMIRLVRLDSKADGVSIKPLDQLPFIPEISHAGVSLEQVRIAEDQILLGDGYSEYVKPFRILEDMHVTASILGYLYRQVVDYCWPLSVAERLISLMLLIRQLAAMKPDSKVLAIAFAGFQRQLDLLIRDLESEWLKVDKEKRENWFRDAAILNVAEKARIKRVEKAWASYGILVRDEWV